VIHFLAPEFSTNHPDSGFVVVGDFGDSTCRNVLITRIGHLQVCGQIRPQLEAVHPATAIPFRHLLVENAASRCHPLHVASGHFSFIAQAVTVLDLAGQDVGDGFDAAMWMPGKSGRVIVGVIVTEIVQQEKWIEFPGFAEAKGALQLDARAFDSRLRFDNLLHCPQ